MDRKKILNSPLNNVLIPALKMYLFVRYLSIESYDILISCEFTKETGLDLITTTKFYQIDRTKSLYT